MSFGQRLKMRRTEFGLLIVAAIFMALALSMLTIAQGETVNSEVAIVIGGFVVVFTIAHLAICIHAPHADQLLLPVVALLNGLGLILIYRLDLTTGRNLASRQVIWTLVAIGLMIMVLYLLKDHRVLTRYSYLLGLIGLILLAMPLAWRTEINEEAAIWITIGRFSLQPGEFSKILLLLFIAQLLVNKRALFNVAGYRILGLEFPRLRDLGPILLVWAIAILIMVAQNDFGPALLLFATVLAMIFLATGRVSWLVIGGFLIALAGVFVYQASPKIQARFSNFWDPLGNIEINSYQLVQALFGMSSGGLFGSGLGQGHPELIPVAESDYILAVLGEEMGFAGFAAVIILFGIFITRGLRAAIRIPDSYGKLVASGLSVTIAIQVFIVVAGITALLPMTGLTTPFMSQGGSSLMANYILLALLLRISDAANKQAAAAKATANAQLQEAA